MLWPKKIFFNEHPVFSFLKTAFMQMQLVYLADLDYILKMCLQLEKYTVFLLQQNIPCYNRLFCMLRRTFTQALNSLPKSLKEYANILTLAFLATSRIPEPSVLFSSRSMGKTFILAVSQHSNLSLPHCHEEKQKLIFLQKVWSIG